MHFRHRGGVSAPDMLNGERNGDEAVASHPDDGGERGRDRGHMGQQEGAREHTTKRGRVDRSPTCLAVAFLMLQDASEAV